MKDLYLEIKEMLTVPLGNETMDYIAFGLLWIIFLILAGLIIFGLLYALKGKS